METPSSNNESQEILKTAERQSALSGEADLVAENHKVDQIYRCPFLAIWSENIAKIVHQRMTISGNKENHNEYNLTMAKQFQMFGTSAHTSESETHWNGNNQRRRSSAVSEIVREPTHDTMSVASDPHEDPLSASFSSSDSVDIQSRSHAEDTIRHVEAIMEHLISIRNTLDPTQTCFADALSQLWQSNGWTRGNAGTANESDSRGSLSHYSHELGFTVARKPHRFFTMGRVFKTYWTEPAGGTAKDLDSSVYNTVGYNERAHSKVRRFIVVRERSQSCLCLPMFTYSGQGTSKAEVRAQDHATAYAWGTEQPPTLSEEGTFEREPFGIVVEDPKERIDSMSRINFAQCYTIQHNVKVAKVGRIHKSHLERFDKEFVAGIATNRRSSTPVASTCLDSPVIAIGTQTGFGSAITATVSGTPEFVASKGVDIINNPNQPIL